MDRKSSSAFYRQFLRFIMFIDLPINRKFTLFSLGVIFWLLALAIVAVVTLLRVDATYSHILQETIPRELAAQKIGNDLATIKLEASDLSLARTSGEVLNHADLILTKIDEIQSLATDLALREEALHVGAEGFGIGTLLAGGEPKKEKYLQEFSGVIAELSQAVRRVTADKIEALLPGSLEGGIAARSDVELQGLLVKAETLSRSYAGEMTSAYRQSTELIGETIRTSFLIMFVVLGLALILLGIFTRWIAVAIAEPIRAITGQIHSLSTGDIDLSEKITISSQDEIGILAAEFNGLMESVYGMTAFKSVIEEDPSLQDVYARLGDIFTSVAQISRYCIYEVQGNRPEMTAVYPVGLDAAALHCQAEVLENCELCRAVKTEHPISSLPFKGVCQQFKGKSADQLHVCVPVNVGGRIGLVVQFLFEPLDGMPIDRMSIPRQVDRATVYLKEAQSVIEAKRLMEELRASALKDALTGLYNRRFLQDHSLQIVAGCQRRGANIGLLMCDLDSFKSVNDQYGHETGDLLLKETATVLLKTVRDADYVIRFGGEEFLILLIDIEEGEVTAVAEKIRLAVAAVRVPTAGGPLCRTISIGSSVYPADGESLWQTINFADVALYKAKEAGRDRVVHFLPEMWSGNRC